MARNFHRRRTAHPIAELNVTNLIDLGFMLLIIFMIVANPTLQKEQTIPVNLPTAEKLPQNKVNPDDHLIAVGVDARGRFYVGDQNTPLNVSELRSRLRAYAAQAKPPIIRIRGDANVPYQKVAEVMAEVQKAGLSRVTFDQQQE